jgi:hypothetical protein
MRLLQAEVQRELADKIIATAVVFIRGKIKVSVLLTQSAAFEHGSHPALGFFGFLVLVHGFEPLLADRRGVGRKLICSLDRARMLNAFGFSGR